MAASFAKRKVSNCQIWVYNGYFPQRFSSTWKVENEKLEIERFFKKHVKCSKTVNEKKEENAEHLSPQLQSWNDSTINLTEESSSKLKTEITSTTNQETTIDHGVSASEVLKAELK